MRYPRGTRGALVAAMLVFIIAPGAGCGSVSTSEETASQVPDPASPPTPEPASPPPPPRAAGARIADEEQLKTLVQGKTTKAEVRGLFGIPQEIVLRPDSETFIYYRDQTSGLFSRTTERVEMLTVRFDTQGILKEFEYRHSGE